MSRVLMKVNNKYIPFVSLIILFLALPLCFAGDFKWDLDVDEVDSDSSRLNLPEIKIPASDGKSLDTKNKQPAIDRGALKKLIDDNLVLRKKIAQSAKDALAVRNMNVRLSAQVTELEHTLTSSIAKIQNLNRQQKESPESAAKATKLEQRLVVAESEKTKIRGELSNLRKRIADMEAEQALVVVPSKAPTPEPHSDLFKEIEKENMLLKEKWVDVETERQKAVKELKKMAKKNEKAEKAAIAAAAREVEAKQKLATVVSSEKDLRSLLKLMPGLEKELDINKTEVEEKELEVEKNKAHIKALMMELERREDRLVKAERMQKILSQAREDLRLVSNSEKRDMHYNMAAVYAKEGRYALAEREYLKALQMDPNDADVHYNLGILYDDDLDNKRRAAIHYRKYLKLKPYSSDLDQVKGWLMRIDMKK